MTENFEPYHVPQQSRRDKLRALAHQNHPSSANSVDFTAAYLPFYDPSLLSSDLLSSHGFGKNTHVRVVKEQGMNFTSFISNVSSSSSSSHVPLNPSLIQDTNNHNNNSNPILYTTQNPQNPRDFDQSYSNNGAGDDDQVAVTGQGLSLSLSSHNNPLGLNVYASILKGSKFLRPAELLLEELCAAKITFDDDDDDEESCLMEFSLRSLSDASMNDDGESRRKKSRLISLLDEVYTRYKQYHQQMQAIVASFECVPGLRNATPHANSALKALSKRFKCLKNMITDQLQFANKHHGRISPLKHERSVHNFGLPEHQPVWRPQRGLPERAVTVLRAWLFEHFLHPYPTDTDKVTLARQTGLSRGQVGHLVEGMQFTDFVVFAYVKSFLIKSKEALCEYDE